MKNILLFIFLIGTTCTFGQSSFKVNLLTSADYSFAKYSYNDGMTNEDLKAEMPLGKSINVELEYTLSSRLSVVSGLRYAHKVIRPRLLLPISYGTSLPTENGDVYISRPHLDKHEFKMLVLPVAFKRYFVVNQKFALYSSLGVFASFKFKEVETYKVSYEWDLERLKDQGVDNNFAYQDDELALFNTAIEIGVGGRYQLGRQLNLILQINASVFELRRGNEKFKKNGDMLWEESFLPIGQASLGLGLQKAF